MPYDEDLADRAREVMPTDAEVTERKMFGGLAFLLRGHMFAGIVGSELMVRIGYEAAQRALELDHVREMDFTGRPMKKTWSSYSPQGCTAPHWSAGSPRLLIMPGPSPLTARASHDAAPDGRSGEIAIPGADDQVGWWGPKVGFRGSSAGNIAQFAAVRW